MANFPDEIPPSPAPGCPWVPGRARGSALRFSPRRFAEKLSQNDSHVEGHSNSLSGKIWENDDRICPNQIRGVAYFL